MEPSSVVRVRVEEGPMLVSELLEPRLRQSPEFVEAERQGWLPWLFVRHYPDAHEDADLDAGTFELWWAFGQGPTQADVDRMTSVAWSIIRDALADRLEADACNPREDDLERPEMALH